MIHIQIVYMIYISIKTKMIIFYVDLIILYVDKMDYIVCFYDEF